MGADDVIDVIAKRLSNAPPDSAGFALADLLLEISGIGFPAENGPKRVDPGTSDSQIALRDFTIRAFNDCENDTVKLDRIVRLCAQCNSLLDLALSGIEVAFVKALARFAEQGDFAVSVTSERGDTPLTAALTVIQRCSTANTNEQIFNVSTLSCLAFLKTLLCQKLDQAPPIPPRWVILLTLMAGVRRRDISMTAKEIAVALLSVKQSEDSLHSDESVPLRPMLWQRVSEFTNHLGEAYYTNIGLSLWLRLLLTTSTLWRPSPAHFDVSYWKALHYFLANGSAEQRKLCLAILRQSLMLLTQPIDCPYMKYEPEVAAQYQSHYNKYATIFETVILARYLNQVQECIPDLNFLCSATALVHPSWIVTLLHASLLHGMQDSIRNLLGPWILRHAPPVLRSTVNAFDFLEHAFLTWATLGYHCTSIIKTFRNAPRCVFGERLANFIARTILLSSSKSEVIGAILRFIDNREERIFSFSRAFLLDGLIRGIREASAKLEPQHIASLSRIGQQHGFQEVVRDLMILQTSELLFDFGQTDDQSNLLLARLRSSVQSVPYRDLVKKYIEAKNFFINYIQDYPVKASEKSLSILSNESLLISEPLQQLSAWVQYSNYSCLAGLGLRAACDLMLAVLETRPIAPAEAVKLHGVIEAMCEEAKRKEYPRGITIDLVQIVFHWKVVKLLTHDSPLRISLGKLAQSLIVMGRTKIYLFPPLAAAIRRATLAVDESKYLPLADLVETYIMEPPQARVEFDLERVMGHWLEERVSNRNYELYYGKPEEYGHACVFDMLNSMHISRAWDECFQQILDKTLERWASQKQPVPVFSGWKTTAQLQVLVLALEQLVPNLTPLRVGKYLDELYSVLQLEPLPRFRFLLEWMIIRIYVNVPEQRQNILERLAGPSFMDVNNPKYTVSMTKISLAIACLANTDEAFGLQVMASLNVLAASQKVAVRHEAQWAFPKIWEHAIRSKWEKATTNIAFQRLNDHITNLDTYKNPPSPRLLEEFDPVEDHNLTYLLQGKYLMIEPSERPLATRKDILSVRANDSERASTELLELAEIGNGYIDEPSRAFEQQVLDMDQNAAAVTPLQTKSTVTDADKLNGEHQRQSSNAIVMASLIDSPYNLGGISRVSEIFGAKTLKVKNIGVTKSRDFASVSVSSHLWFPVEELKVTKIIEFLRQCKGDGYKIVGIEQTDSSQILGRQECQLPKNAVFVLGSEKEGIPADMLAEMDTCVEISQAGITRSLNVQTALAVALYEHQRQHK